MTKNYVELKIQANPYQMISEAVERGLLGGMRKFYKNADNHLGEEEEEELLQVQRAYIMSAIGELFYNE